MNNVEVSGLLRNVATSYIIKNEGKFRFQIIAYQRAADSIENTSIQLSDYFKEGKLGNIPGIGASIKTHLEELFTTGKVKHFEWALEGIPKTTFVLMKIPSFGPKKAYRLVQEFGLDNPKTVIADLTKLAKKGKIAPLKGFGEKSESDMLRAIGEFKEGKGKTTRMVLPIASEISDQILEYLRKSPFTADTRPLGSLRRRLPTVGDIDIAVASDQPDKIIEHFTSYPHIERIIEKGEITSSILVSGGRQVDLMVQPPKAFGSLLQHFTGSKNHNISLREYALKKGLSLSEKGMKDLKARKGTMLQFSTEESFYNKLGLEWIPPEIREGTTEIELAEENRLPKLVKNEDIKGDFHIHSNFPIEPSHDLGKSSITEMAEIAEKEYGYSYMGFSEHNSSISKHTKSEIKDLILRRNEHIEQVLSGNKSIRILKLLEVDILPSGKLAIDDDSLELLDFAIVSIHSVFSMNRTTMTERVINGLSHPKAKLLAHPTGRLLNQRAGYELDWEKIFEFVKKNNKALEINAWPTRLDLPDTVVRQAVEAGVKMIINTDSHAAWQMKHMQYGVSVARRGWAQKSDILNTLEYNKLREWINS